MATVLCSDIVAREVLLQLGAMLAERDIAVTEPEGAQAGERARFFMALPSSELLMPIAQFGKQHVTPKLREVVDKIAAERPPEHDLVTVPPDVPPTAFGVVVTGGNGLHVRIIPGYDEKHDQCGFHVDCQYGFQRRTP
jgi:hypothetical protein